MRSDRLTGGKGGHLSSSTFFALFGFLVSFDFLLISLLPRVPSACVYCLKLKGFVMNKVTPLLKG